MTARKLKIEKLMNALKNGREYTTAQLENRTGLRNVSAAISTLRQEGVEIVTMYNGASSAYTYRRVA